MTTELPLDDEIVTWLHYYGIREHVEIEEDAKGMILAALRKEDIVSVTLDEEGGLSIEYSE